MTPAGGQVHCGPEGRTSRSQWARAAHLPEAGGGQRGQARLRARRSLSRRSIWAAPAAAAHFQGDYLAITIHIRLKQPVRVTGNFAAPGASYSACCAPEFDRLEWTARRVGQKWTRSFSARQLEFSKLVREPRRPFVGRRLLGPAN